MSEIRIVFDGPPSHESGRFVEVENPEGVSIGVGRWVERSDGLWELQIPGVDLAIAEAAHLEERQIQAIKEEERREEIAANGAFGVGA